MTVLPSDFNCTTEQLETLYTKIDLHHLVQDTRIAVRNFHQRTGDSTSSFGRFTDCSWVNYRVLDDCNNNQSNLNCRQQAIKAYFTADDGQCENAVLRTEFHLCQDH